MKTKIWGETKVHLAVMRECGGGAFKSVKAREAACGHAFDMREPIEMTDTPSKVTCARCKDHIRATKNSLSMLTRPVGGATVSP